MKHAVRLIILLPALAMTGCANSLFKSSPPAEPALVETLNALQKQREENPQDLQLITKEHQSRQDYVRGELKQADSSMERGDYAAAFDYLENVLQQEPSNFKARQSIEQVKRRQQMTVDLAKAERISQSDPQEALEIVRRILVEHPSYANAQRLRDELLRIMQERRTMRPQLSDALRKPVSLNFRAQPIMSIFDVISRLSGVNFIFDHEVKTDALASIFAQRTTAEDAINLLLRTNQLEKKILDKHTLLIYPARPEKDRNYKDFAIRTFFLSHAEAKSVMTALRQLIKPKDIYVDERVNAVVVRDTPETIQVAERLVMGLDLPQSEVTLDVQVLEINLDDSLDLGVQYPGKIQFNALSGNDSSLPLTLGDLLRINRDRIGVSSESAVLSLAIDILQKQGKTKTLANPKIRVRNMEKASIKIGERVPIVTTTNANGVVTESVSYQDVGLSLKVEPRISLNDEVSVKVEMEVSNILSTEKTKTGLVAYSLGTRNAETLMTAKNGETQILAGLVKRKEVEKIAGLPGLSAIPILGRLFGHNGRANEKTEIVLLITPHIERNLDLPEAAVSTFLAGTESRVTTEALTLGTTPETAANPSGKQQERMPELHEPIVPADAPSPEAAEVKQDKDGKASQKGEAKQDREAERADANLKNISFEEGRDASRGRPGMMRVRDGSGAPRLSMRGERT